MHGRVAGKWGVSQGPSKEASAAASMHAVWPVHYVLAPVYREAGPARAKPRQNDTHTTTNLAAYPGGPYLRKRAIFFDFLFKTCQARRAGG